LDLFDYASSKANKDSQPLAEKMRPRTLEGFVGQEHIAGEGALIRNAIEKDKIFSMILWGPPGCGKTTLARIVAIETQSYFAQFSAVLSGVKDIRSVIEEAKNQIKFNKKRTILFVDEIHRFNKAQQDAFLGHVESGLITLIGATTENPSFEVIPALLSRCRVITLNQLSTDHIAVIIQRAIKDKENGLGKSEIKLEKDALDHLVQISDGDVRTALNGLEIASQLLLTDDDPATKKQRKSISLKLVEKALQKKALLYDKSGEEHYNIISALHKSLRGSDPDAALYWLARMLVAGEDPLYIARRMVRFASEDIGNADPTALQVTINAMEAFRFLGQPEGELALAQAAVYLATAPKSNSVYTAYNDVKEDIEKTGALPVPLHIRNAPTKLMKDLGYGKGYKYAHDFQDAYVPQRYLPDTLKGKIYYTPSERAYEKVIKERLEKWRSLQKRKKNKEGDK
jgi:putative ATPase